MANYLSLEEAAKKLGIPTDRLVELRSQGKVRGFRDGSSWKFPEASIEQLQDDLASTSDEGSGILVDPSGQSGGSDVHLAASEGDGSDVAVVAGDSDKASQGSGSGLQEIDSADLKLNDPAIMHDSAQLDLDLDPDAGSTGPVTDEELKEISESHPDVLAAEKKSAEAGGSAVDIGGNDVQLDNESGLSFSSGPQEHDSGEEMIGVEDEDSGRD